jgi:hypothetical protein
MTNVECRIKEFFLFYLLKKQSEATSTIRSASGGSIVIRHSMKFHAKKIKLRAAGEYDL